MSAQLRTIEHVIAGQHIREYPDALRHRQEDELQIAVKQYVPIHDAEPVPRNAVTVIGVPANGMLKVHGLRIDVASNCCLTCI